MGGCKGLVPASLVLLALHGVVAGAALQLALSVPGTVRPRNVHVVPQSRKPAVMNRRENDNQSAISKSSLAGVCGCREFAIGRAAARMIGVLVAMW